MTIQISDSAEISQMLLYSFNSNNRFLGIDRIGRSSKMKSVLGLLQIPREKKRKRKKNPRTKRLYKHDLNNKNSRK